MHLKILLVDDHEVVRLGLKSLLSRYKDFQVVAEPGKSGIEATREITQKFPGTKVIMLTSYAEEDLLFEAIAAGAAGYVLKQIGSGELVRALETIGRGESLLDPALTQKVFQRVRDASRKAEDEAFAELNNQELKILSLIAEGKSNKAIADQVYLSEKTVRNYVSSLLS